AVPLTIARDGKQLDVALTPKFQRELKDGAGNVVKDEHGQPMHGYVLGLALNEQYDRVRVGPIGVIENAFEYPVDKTKDIAVGLYLFATGQVEGRVSGPVGMADMVHQAFTSGWVTAIELVMMLNVYLGL